MRCLYDDFDAILVAANISEKNSSDIISGLGFTIAMNATESFVPAAIVINICDKDPISQAMMRGLTSGGLGNKKRFLRVEYGSIGMGGYAAKCWGRALEDLIFLAKK